MRSRRLSESARWQRRGQGGWESTHWMVPDGIANAFRSKPLDDADASVLDSTPVMCERHRLAVIALTARSNEEYVLQAMIVTVAIKVAARDARTVMSRPSHLALHMGAGCRPPVHTTDRGAKRPESELDCA